MLKKKILYSNFVFQIKKKMKILFTLLFLFHIILSSSRVIFISNLGNDTPDCGYDYNPCYSIEYANQICQMNDIISLTSGIFYLKKTVTLKQGVTLKSNDSNNMATIYPSAVNLEQVGIKLLTEGYLKDFIISNFQKTAIIVNIENRNQMNCNLTNLIVSGNKQGISIISSGVFLHKVLVKNCLIFSNIFNTTGCEGAGLQVRDSVIELTGNTIEKNKCEGNGGGVNVYDSQVYGDANSITNNYANFGGGLFGEMSQLYLSRLILENNNAMIDGGGLHTSSCETYLDLNGSISNNLAFGNGGGIWTYMGWTNATIVAFAFNKASNGGAIYATQATLWTNVTTWESNLASNGSGGAMALFSCTVMLNNTMTTHGEASLEGGAMYLFDCTTILWNISFVMNTAAGGGAVSVSEGTTIMWNSTVTYNIATSLRGGAFQVNGSSWIAYSTVIHDNRAAHVNDGAAFYLDVSTLVATNVTFINNIIDSTQKEEDVVCYDSSTNCYDTHPTIPVIVCLQQCDALIVYNNTQKVLCHQ